MLGIFNILKPFFEDVYREISVREYARMRKISPPNASSILKGLVKEGILVGREERNFLFFRADKESFLFKDLALAYWRFLLRRDLSKLHERLLFPRVVLFGSVAKVENNKDSDLDLFLDVKRREIDVKEFNKKLGRNVQFHFRDSLRNKELAENIEKGVEIF